MPETLPNDIALLVRHESAPADYVDPALRGAVDTDGNLQTIIPFERKRGTPFNGLASAPAVELPPELAEVLRNATTARPFGLVIVGTSAEERDSRMSMAEAAVPFTEYAGPLARVQPTFRSGYSRNDTPLSAAFAGAPVFPSIESAYASGYRRIAIESAYHGAQEAMLKYAADVCFLVSADSAEVSGALIGAISSQDYGEKATISKIVVVMGAAVIETKNRTVTICDAYYRITTKYLLSALVSLWSWSRRNVSYVGRTS
jgi:hypothetical protein